jgi:hypothetical protein
MLNFTVTSLQGLTTKTQRRISHVSCILYTLFIQFPWSIIKIGKIKNLIRCHQIILDIYTSTDNMFRRLCVICRSDFSLKKHCLDSALYWRTYCGLKLIKLNQIKINDLHVCPASWSSGQSFWLLIMGSRVRFPVLSCGFFLEGGVFHDDHGLGSSVELKFKAPPGASYSYITIQLIGTT